MKWTYLIRFNLLSEHVKTYHDVTFYSSTTYSCQQVLCGRLVKAAHLWLHKENQTSTFYNAVYDHQVAYLRAQLALRDAQIEQVKAERDNHFVQEEEVLAHMRLLSSEAKDWKSRVVTEAEEVLCRESAQMAQQATKAQEAMDQHYKAKWQQAEADLTALCQSNSV